MARILFFLLCGLFLPALKAQSIEIYVGGHKFDSLQAYMDSKKVSLAPAALNSREEDYIRSQAQQMGINVDFNKIKTLQVRKKSASISPQILHQWYVLSVEHGVTAALRDFYRSRGVTDWPLTRRIWPDQLQEAIQEAVTVSDAPKLLIAGPGKVRIMALTAQKSQ